MRSTCARRAAPRSGADADAHDDAPSPASPPGRARRPERRLFPGEVLLRPHLLLQRAPQGRSLASGVAQSPPETATTPSKAPSTPCARWGVAKVRASACHARSRPPRTRRVVEVRARGVSRSSSPEVSEVSPCAISANATDSTRLQPLSDQLARLGRRRKQSHARVRVACARPRRPPARRQLYRRMASRHERGPSGTPRPRPGAPRACFAAGARTPRAPCASSAPRGDA